MSGAAVSLLALIGALVQPWAGRALDAGRLSMRKGLVAGTATIAGGLAAAALPSLIGVLLAAVLIGTGTGLVTPLGFAAVAGGAPPERLGQTLGAAELGRELGDTGGPLVVALVASASGLAAGFGALAGVVVVVTVVVAAPRGAQRRRRVPRTQ